MHAITTHNLADLVLRLIVLGEGKAEAEKLPS